ncbi:hypothetical protein B0I35DRAFT_268717 [Stachybotrys elegans]|uniref:Zn(2)-C6 fungal-type domain-containing protein n=1 Tax=Stachybotrys elegans TaxID=80388 RepID=A0A8K0SSQ0_9HYPO|nr:hypothetical protein B0I35DRAFT_268717 [Stachybotrys elegans]
MVYCGKASQGCQSCRVRRIKCDKLKPDCSQCIRVGKKCPGYRDQLSLMFRDESSKVIQKAHAQWGVGEGPDGSPIAPTPASSGSPAYSFESQSSPVSPPSPKTSQSAWPPAVSIKNHMASSATPATPVITASTALCSSIQPTVDEQGIQFFFTKYVLGHPDEPRTFEDLRLMNWYSAPGLQDIMAAVGLSGLANLGDRRDLVVAARHHYGKALRQAGQDIRGQAQPSLDVTVRSVVSLALFELVNGLSEDTKTVHAHIMGGVALMRQWIPMPNTPFGGIRGLIQLCYTLFIVARMGGTRLPPVFADWIAFSRSIQPPQDHPSTDLGTLISRFIDISSFVRNHSLTDGRPTTTSTMQELYDLDDEFDKWAQERKDDGIWAYTTGNTVGLPPEAVLEGEYHKYYDMWSARIWNHYRWGRMALNETLLELVDSNPLSNQALTEPADRNKISELIRRMARDTLVSIPSHWRHPRLGDNMPLPIEVVSGAGSGPAAVGLLIYHIKAAGCAPGVPLEYGSWAQGILDCIWRDMGMLRARAMKDDLEAYLERQRRNSLDRHIATSITAQGTWLEYKNSDRRENTEMMPAQTV